MITSYFVTVCHIKCRNLKKKYFEIIQELSVQVTPSDTLCLPFLCFLVHISLKLLFTKCILNRVKRSHLNQRICSIQTAVRQEAKYVRYNSPISTVMIISFTNRPFSSNGLMVHSKFQNCIFGSKVTALKLLPPSPNGKEW